MQEPALLTIARFVAAGFDDAILDVLIDEPFREVRNKCL